MDLGVLQNSILGPLEDRCQGWICSNEIRALVKQSQRPAFPFVPALPGYSTDHPKCCIRHSLGQHQNHVIDGLRQVRTKDGFRDLVGY
jgi:hypothetical protein